MPDSDSLMPGRGRPPRWKVWDYSERAGYFVTFVVQNRDCCLGRLGDEQIELSSSGKLVEQVWRQLPDAFPTVTLDEVCIMPNHVHAIIWLRLDSPDSGALIHQSSKPEGFRPMMADPTVVLGKVVRSWKAKSTLEIRRNVDPSFSWLSRYWDGVIRDYNELEHIRNYIISNPLRWDKDRENPKARTVEP